MIQLMKGGKPPFINIRGEKGMGSKVVLSLENVSKKYPGVLALNKVSMDFLEGEVHALLGEMALVNPH